MMRARKRDGFWNLITSLLSHTGNKVRKLTAVTALIVGLAIYFDPEKLDEVAEEFDISQSYAYKLKKKASGFIDSLQGLENINGDILVIDENQVIRTIISLHCEGKCSQSQIKKIIKDIYSREIGTDKIGQIINKYSRLAIPVNEELDKKCMPHIKTLGADEIFINKIPIFTAVDLCSTYVALISPQHDRTAETWELAFSLLKDAGLSPSTVISDACGSLLLAITKCFGSEITQMDVFHHLKDLMEEYFQVRRKLEMPMTEATKIEERALTQKPQEKTIARYVELTDNIIPENQRLIDTMDILISWVRELFAFPGYSLEESMEEIKWCLDQMEALMKGFHKMTNEIKRCRGRFDVTFEYLRRFFKSMKEEAVVNGIDYALLEQVYYLKRYDPTSIAYSKEYTLIYNAFGNNEELFSKALSTIERLCKATKRASSLVENVNSRVRVFLNDKRGMSDYDAQLIRLYMNCRPYPKSRIIERRHKSPIEILLKTSEYDFYALLGIGEPKKYNLEGIIA